MTKGIISNSKIILPMIPVLIGAAGLTSNPNKVYAEETETSIVEVGKVNQQITQNIETKTVFYSGSKEEQFDENTQDKLVSNEHYNTETSGTGKGVSATFLLEENEKATSSLLSEKALIESDSKEVLKAAETKQENEKKEEEKNKKEEEEKEKQKVEEKKKEEELQTSVVGQNGEKDIVPNYYGIHSYPLGECTWGAKALAPWAGDYWGNGGDWGRSARAAGFKTGTQPMVGAIASWDNGGYGHVAVVTAVDGGMIKVKESNYGGVRQIGDHRGWFNPQFTSEGAVTFIYPPGT